MQKLMAELGRLYLVKDQQCRETDADTPSAPLSEALFRRHLQGESTVAIDLVDGNGATRTMLIALHGAANAPGSPHWDTVCEVANALQTQLGLPAPAVSISGGNGYGLWLSLETPVPAARAQQFLQLLRHAYLADIDEDEVSLFPGEGNSARDGQSEVELPPCLHRATGRWAAFINPGMGASFADEPGLDMSPPAAAQAAFLDSLQSISAPQFDLAMATLQQQHGAGTPETAPDTAAGPRAISEGLLLKDATLEDIVRHLHEKNIEPTFRHRIAK